MPDREMVLIEVRPGNFTLTALDDTVRLSAEGVDRRGRTIPDKTFEWSSSDTTVATVAPTGTVTAVGNGTATVTASAEGVQGTAIVVVQQVVAMVSLTPKVDTLYAVGDTTRLRAEVVDARGHPVPHEPINWWSSHNAVATVADGGLVRGMGDGAAVINARAGTQVGQADVRVILPLASVRVTPDTATLLRETSVTLAAAVADSAGHALSRTVTWTSTDTAVARVTSSGEANARVRGIAPGTAAIVASVEDLRDTARVTVIVVEFASVVASGPTSCGLTTAGAAYCWGRNREGQLGTGSTVGPETCQGIFAFACSTVPVRAAAGLDLTQLSGSRAGWTCGLSDGGVAYCWGGRYGPTPAAIQTSASFTSITVGGFHGCGLTAEGAAYCWGENNVGQLGTGDTLSSAVPRAVSGGLAFRSLSAGWDHTCGLTTEGTAYCWGDHHHGQLGAGAVDEVCGFYDEPLPCSRAPRPVEGGLTFESLSTYGSLHTCALTAEGVAYCWGSNNLGQLGIGLWTAPEICESGHGDLTCSRTPAAVSTELRFRTLSAGHWHVCAITEDDALHCWGSNVYFQLGRPVDERCGGVPCSTRPILLSDALRFVSIGRGEEHVCGATTGGAYCWGDGSAGQLGIGRTTEISGPGRVVGQP